MPMLSPKEVYEHLQHIEEVDAVSGAVYRQEAIEAITDPTVSQNWQERICDRLNEANRDMTLLSAGPEDSY